MTLTPLDLALISVPLVLVISVALALRRSMKSVADFLAASRCAGRYLIATAGTPGGSAAMTMVVALELFSSTGFSIGFWINFTGVFVFMFTLFGLVTYRLRETRCLTFHQFFELRYSKGIRVFCSFMAFFSGLINFGLVPAVGARFFVYFCGLPEWTRLGGLTCPTYAVIMIVLMAISLTMALSGGQISVMVTDCIEGLISSLFYLVVIFFVLSTISTRQMQETMLSGTPGKSFVNPFDISGRQNFDGWYIVLVLIFNIYIFRGNAWSQGSNAAARTAHESKMAGIVSTWRGFGAGTMLTLISMAAFTVLHHPDYAHQRELVAQGLKNASPQLQTQMSMPMALGMFLGPGAKGAFCAVTLFGLLSTQGGQLHGLGSTFLQDLVLPLRKKQFSPRAHLLALRLSAVGVAVFVCIFSLFYKPADYLTLLTTLIGAIYLGGIGALLWGGLYWKRGTTAGAWGAMITGTTLALGFNILQPFWTSVQPTLLHWAGQGQVANFLAAHPERCPFNGQQFSVASALCALAVYIVVSLLTYRRDFNMDSLLHRGEYTIPLEDDVQELPQPGFRWGKLIGIDEHYTTSDRVVAAATFGWAMCMKITSISILTWWLLFGKQSDQWWFKFHMLMGVRVTLVVTLLATTWLGVGAIYDLIALFRTLRSARRNDRDDGTVRGHHNVGDPALKESTPASVSVR